MASRARLKLRLDSFHPLWSEIVRLAYGGATARVTLPEIPTPVVEATVTVGGVTQTFVMDPSVDADMEPGSGAVYVTTWRPARPQ